MNWIKMHKLWSLLFLYLGIGILVGSIIGYLGIVDTGALGQLMGVFLWPYLFLCFIALRILKK